MFLCCVLIFFVFVSFSPVLSGECYDVYGDDMYNLCVGSGESFASIQDAIDSVSDTGVRIYVRGGIYMEMLLLDGAVHYSGSPSYINEILPFKDEAVVIEISPTIDSVGFLISGVYHWHIHSGEGSLSFTTPDGPAIDNQLLRIESGPGQTGVVLGPFNVDCYSSNCNEYHLVAVGGFSPEKVVLRGIVFGKSTSMGYAGIDVDIADTVIFDTQEPRTPRIVLDELEFWNVGTTVVDIYASAVRLSGCFFSTAAGGKNAGAPVRIYGGQGVYIENSIFADHSSGGGEWIRMENTNVDMSRIIIQNNLFVCDSPQLYTVVWDNTGGQNVDHWVFLNNMLDGACFSTTLVFFMSPSDILQNSYIGYNYYRGSGGATANEGGGFVEGVLDMDSFVLNLDGVAPHPYYLPKSTPVLSSQFYNVSDYYLYHPPTDYLNVTRNTEFAGPFACWSVAFPSTHDCGVCAFGYKNDPAVPDVDCMGCELDHFHDTNSGLCKPCMDGCLNCSVSDHCDNCETSYVWMDAGKSVCSWDCSDYTPPLFYGNGPFCEDCTASGTFSMEGCDWCDGENSCMSCGEGYYLSGSECVNCDASCMSCMGATSMDCTECFQGYYMDGGYCYMCGANCAYCFNDVQCSECVDGYALLIDDCVDTCPAGYFRDYDSYPEECVQCSANCISCNMDECIECEVGFYRLHSECVDTCPSEYYPEESGAICEYCGGGCISCDAPWQCLDCDVDHYLETDENGDTYCVGVPVYDQCFQPRTECVQITSASVCNECQHESIQSALAAINDTQGNWRILLCGEFGGPYNRIHEENVVIGPEIMSGKDLNNTNKIQAYQDVSVDWQGVVGTIPIVDIQSSFWELSHGDGHLTIAPNWEQSILASPVVVNPVSGVKLGPIEILITYDSEDIHPLSLELPTNDPDFKSYLIEKMKVECHYHPNDICTDAHPPSSLYAFGGVADDRNFEGGKSRNLWIRNSKFRCGNNVVVDLYDVSHVTIEGCMFEIMSPNVTSEISLRTGQASALRVINNIFQGGHMFMLGGMDKGIVHYEFHESNPNPSANPLVFANNDVNIESFSPTVGGVVQLNTSVSGVEIAVYVANNIFKVLSETMPIVTDASTGSKITCSGQYGHNSYLLPVTGETYDCGTDSAQDLGGLISSIDLLYAYAEFEETPSPFFEIKDIDIVGVGTDIASITPTYDMLNRERNQGSSARGAMEYFANPECLEDCPGSCSVPNACDVCPSERSGYSCQCSYPCHNGNTEDEYDSCSGCFCHDNWDGDACEICTLVCENGGSPDADCQYCQSCSAGWGGALCDIPCAGCDFSLCHQEKTICVDVSVDQLCGGNCGHTDINTAIYEDVMPLIGGHTIYLVGDPSKETVYSTMLHIPPEKGAITYESRNIIKPYPGHDIVLVNSMDPMFGGANMIWRLMIMVSANWWEFNGGLDDGGSMRIHTLANPGEELNAGAILFLNVNSGIIRGVDMTIPGDAEFIRIMMLTATYNSGFIIEKCSFQREGHSTKSTNATIMVDYPSGPDGQIMMPPVPLPTGDSSMDTAPWGGYKAVWISECEFHNGGISVLVLQFVTIERCVFYVDYDPIMPVISFENTHAIAAKVQNNIIVLNPPSGLWDMPIIFSKFEEERVDSTEGLFVWNNLVYSAISGVLPAYQSVVAIKGLHAGTGKHYVSIYNNLIDLPGDDYYLVKGEENGECIGEFAYNYFAGGMSLSFAKCETPSGAYTNLGNNAIYYFFPFYADGAMPSPFFELLDQVPGSPDNNLASDYFSRSQTPVVYSAGPLQYFQDPTDYCPTDCPANLNCTVPNGPCECPFGYGGAECTDCILTPELCGGYSPLAGCVCGCPGPNFDPESGCLTCINHYSFASECLDCESGFDIDSLCMSCLPNFVDEGMCKVCADGFDIATECATCKANYVQDGLCGTCKTGFDIDLDCAECTVLHAGPNCTQCAGSNYLKWPECTSCINDNFNTEFCVESDCKPEYFGKNCRDTTCFGVWSNDSSVCSGRGCCKLNNLCLCDEHYSGDQCEISDCFGIFSNMSQVCSGHGNCVEYLTCECSDGWGGERCESNLHATTFSIITLPIPPPGHCGLVNAKKSVSLEVLFDEIEYFETHFEGLTYEWTLEDLSASVFLDLEDPDIVFSNSRILGIHKGSLNDGSVYSACVIVKYNSQYVNQMCTTFETNDIPKGGRCDVVPRAKFHQMQTEVEVHCQDFEDNHLPLSFELVYVRGGEDIFLDAKILGGNAEGSFTFVMPISGDVHLFARVYDAHRAVSFVAVDGGDLFFDTPEIEDVEDVVDMVLDFVNNTISTEFSSETYLDDLVTLTTATAFLNDLRNCSGEAGGDSVVVDDVADTNMRVEVLSAFVQMMGNDTENVGSSEEMLMPQVELIASVTSGIVIETSVGSEGDQGLDDTKKNFVETAVDVFVDIVTENQDILDENAITASTAVVSNFLQATSSFEDEVVEDEVVVVDDDDDDGGGGEDEEEEERILEEQRVIDEKIETLVNVLASSLLNQAVSGDDIQVVEAEGISIGAKKGSGDEISGNIEFGGLKIDLPPLCQGETMDFNVGLKLQNIERNLHGAKRSSGEGKKLGHDKKVNSTVVAITFNTTCSTSNLPEPLIIELKPKKNVGQYSGQGNSPCEDKKKGCPSLGCGWWDEEALDWSYEGCEKIEETEDYVLCACTHTTDFAAIGENLIPEINVLTPDDFANIVRLSEDNWDSFIVVCVLVIVYLVLMVGVEFFSLCEATFRKTSRVADNWFIHHKEEEEKTKEKVTTVAEIQKTLKRDPPRYVQSGIRTFLGEHKILSVLFPLEDEKHFGTGPRLTIVFMSVFSILMQNALTYDTNDGGIFQTIFQTIITNLITLPVLVAVTFMFVKTNPRMGKAKKKDVDTLVNELSGEEEVKKQEESTSKKEQPVQAEEEKNEAEGEEEGSKEIKEKKKKMKWKELMEVKLKPVNAIIEKVVIYFKRNIQNRFTVPGVIFLLVVTILYFAGSTVLSVLLFYDITWLKGAGGIYFFLTISILLYIGVCGYLLFSAKLRTYMRFEWVEWYSQRKWVRVIQVFGPLVTSYLSISGVSGGFVCIFLLEGGYVEQYLDIILTSMLLFGGCFAYSLLFLLFILRKPNRSKKKSSKKKEEEENQSKFLFPFWVKYFTYILSWGFMGVCSYFLVLYGIKFDSNTESVWMGTSVACFAEEFVLQEPIEVIVKSVILVAILNLFEIVFFSRGKQADLQDASTVDFAIAGEWMSDKPPGQHLDEVLNNIYYSQHGLEEHKKMDYELHDVSESSQDGQDSYVEKKKEEVETEE